MSNLYKRFETSDKLATKGFPVKLDKNDDGTVPTFHIARSHTSNQLFAKAVKDHYPEGSDNLSDEELTKRNVLVFVDGNLIGWDNVQDREGQALKFGRDNAVQLMTDLPELFEVLRNESVKLSNYLKANEEKAVKN